MRFLKIVMIILIASALIGFVKTGRSFHFAWTLPFAGGDPPCVYDLGAICLLGLVVWGIWRLNNPPDNDSQ